MPSAKILFLDLATQTGWAIGVPGEPIQSGTLRLGDIGKDQSKRFAAYETWLRRMILEHKPAEVSFERPMDPRHMANKRTGKATTHFDTIRLLLGLCAITEAQARLCNVPELTECSVNAIRAHLLRGRPPKGEAKRQVTRMLEILGFRPADDNEADAIAGWLYVSAIRAPGADIATPLPLGAARV